MADHDHLRDVVDVIGAAATPVGAAVAARRFPDALTDAYSVAAAAIGADVRAPDPHEQRQLASGAAVAAASGLLTYPIAATGRWWRELPGPAVAGDPQEAVAVLPRAGGAALVRPPDRTPEPITARRRLPGPADVLVGDLPADPTWRHLLAWSLRRWRHRLRLLAGLSVVGGLAALLLPVTTGALFSYAIPQGLIGTAVAILTAFAIGSVGAAIVVLARNIVIVGLRDRSDVTVATSVMAHALRLPLPFYRRLTPGDTLNRLLSVQQARTAVDDGVPAQIITAAFGVVNLFVLLAISPLLTLLITAVIALVVAATLGAQVRARSALAAVLEERSRSDAALMALADAIVPIRVQGAEARALGQWARLQGRAVAAFATRLRRLNTPQPLLAAGPGFVNVALVLAVVLVGSAALPLREFMPAYAAVVQLTVAMGLLTASVVQLWELGPVLSRLDPITTTPVERPGPRRPVGPLAGTVALTDVVFGYDVDRPPLFAGLSLASAPGEFVALVGPSGSGKSTILRLILGFEQPWSGVVTYDGKDLAELDVAAVRRQVGTVLQSSVPFGDTVREAIAGPLRLADDRLWEILDEAGLALDVRDLPLGLDTPVGERGATLSGGQRQRLMIARALAGDPGLLLLDEATSALDNVTQQVVMQSILARPITRIVVAHRLSTIERADRVLVVAGGRIAETGTPDELLRRGGHFARLAARQEF